MKQFLTRFLVVVMMITFALALVSCKKDKDESESTSAPTSEVTQSQPTSTPESKPESTPESKPEVVPPVDTDPVQAVDGVDVSPILDILNPILGNEYVTIEFSMDMTTTDSSSSTQTIDVTAHIKNTGAGYDLIATMELKNSYTYGGDTESFSRVLDVYYVDGMLALGMTAEGETMYLKDDVGTVNELLTGINGMIASEPEMKAAYEQAMPAIENLLAAIDEADLNRVAINETIDLKVIIDDVLDYIVKNADVDLYTVVLRDLVGIDPADTAAVTAFENEILALGAGDPTMAQVLDRVVALVNSKLPQENQISLKAFVDALQSELGISTADAVEMFNKAYMGYWIWDEDLQESVWCDDDYLPAPEAGVSIYDYAYNLLNSIKLNAILAEEDFDSFQDFYSYIKGALKMYTFGDWVNDVFGSQFGSMTEEYVGEGNGDHAWVSDEYHEYVGEGNGDHVWNEEDGWMEYVGEGNGDYFVHWDSYLKYVGEGNGDYAYVEVDYVEKLMAMVGVVTKCEVKLTYTPDAMGRPVTAGAVLDMAVNMGGQTGTQTATVEISFSYAQPSISFEIPAEVLANAGDLSDAMGGGNAESEAKPMSVE